MSDETQTVTIAEVMAAYRLTQRVDEALKKHGLNVALLAILATFAAEPGAANSAAIRALDMAPGAVTLNLDKLERADLVTRTGRYERDRRRVTVDLTDRGREVLAAFATIEIAPDETEESA